MRSTLPTSKLSLVLIVLAVMLALFLLVACQDNEPVDLTLVAMGPTLTYQVEIVNIMTSQALTPRPTREPRRFTAWPTYPPPTPSPDPNNPHTPTPAPNTIIIPAGAAAVLDGQLDEGEWDDAAAITLSVHDNWPIEVLFQHDDAHLYVAYTGLDADPVAVFPELFLDSNPDTQEIWDGNNWWFHLSTGPCWGQGNNLLWQTCGQPSNWNSTTFVQNSGVIEMQIPYRTINLSAGSNKNIGFLVSLFSLTDADEEQRQLWPSTSDWEKPPTWGIAQPEDNW